MAVRPNCVAGISEDDLLHLAAEDQWVEVVNGELVAMSPTGYHNAELVFHVAKLLDRYVFERGLGFVLPEGLVYILEQAPDGSILKSRVPNVSFIRRNRIPIDFDRDMPFPGAPDLAVKIVSPSESRAALFSRLRDYLDAGTEQVWMLYSETEEVHQYRRDQPGLIHTYMGDEIIGSDDLFPGLVIQARDLFDLPSFED
ncbi:MAG: Uma2 family endonuclease [Chloroflexi bacterium]|nr:Uma2 family endonuclease [Chloroflexota bacterium]